MAGIVRSCTPHPDNLIPGGIDLPDELSPNGTKHYENAMKTLVIPEGVKGFVSDFLCHWAVTEKFVLPESLQFIGGADVYSDGSDSPHNVFAGCYLPEVVLPGRLQCLGFFAFGRSHIRKLIVPPTVKSPYLRQFKDSTIEELYLSKSALDAFCQLGINEEYGFYQNFFVHCKCRIIPY